MNVPITQIIAVFLTAYFLSYPALLWIAGEKAKQLSNADAVNVLVTGINSRLVISGWAVSVLLLWNA